MTGALEASGLSMRYGSLPPALADVSLVVAPGEVLAVIGRSGSGKSSLARLLVGLPPAGAQAAGWLRWPSGAAPVTEARRAGLSRQIAWLPQDAHAALHPMLRLGSQVAETLRATDRAAGPDAVAAALHEVELDPSIARRYPHQVSGGQAQRTALACALAQRPAVLVADEPTSALDADTGRAVLDTLSSLVRQHGVALVLVSHDLQAVRRMAARVGVLDRGRWVEEGETCEVLSRPRSDAAAALVEADAALRKGMACSAHAT